MHQRKPVIGCSINAWASTQLFHPGSLEGKQNPPAEVASTAIEKYILNKSDWLKNDSIF